MSINELQHQVIEDFSLFEDWMGKYEHIIEYGKALSPIDEKYKTEENLVRGCQSRVWLHAEFKDGLIFFEADSDAVITKGLAGLMVRVLSGHTPEEIATAELFFIDKTGLKEHLSPNRSNGLVSMVKTMKSYAVGFALKNL